MVLLSLLSLLRLKNNPNQPNHFNIAFKIIIPTEDHMEMHVDLQEPEKLINDHTPSVTA